jgi:hypothetical protein
VDLAASYGLVPDPWQAAVLAAWLGRGPDDRFTATSCGLSVPRQNGKNALIEMRELYGMCVIGERVLHTAHEVKTARKAFVRICGFFDDARRYPELAAMVAGIRRTNGQEAILLTNGASVEFSARSRSASRGFTADVVVFDEAQELTDEQQDAIFSTMAAAPLGNRQAIYTGTPPSENSPGEVFARVRRDAWRGEDGRLAWHEWSVDAIGDVSDRERWYETNPGLGIRLSEDFTMAELMRLSEDGFARERLGWWASAGGRAVITAAQWAALLERRPPKEGRTAFGVKFSVDGASVALAAAIRPKAGKPHVELVEARPAGDGMAWLAQRLIEAKGRAAAIVIDGRSGTDALVAALHEGKVSRKAIVVPGTRGVIASATMLYDAVRRKAVTHYGQRTLDAAALAARKRTIGHDGGWGFGSDGDADITPIEAASLAYWGAMTTRRNPGKGTRISL